LPRSHEAYGRYRISPISCAVRDFGKKAHRSMPLYCNSCEIVMPRRL
jgi:hypothetical protein